MSPAYLVLLAWLAAFIVSCAAVVLHAVRHRTRGLAMSLRCPLGAALMFGFVSVAVGLAEGAWGFRSSGLWIAMSAGTAGLALEVLGWRAVLRQRIRFGQCRSCGYELGGLSTCPECGVSA